MAVNVKLWGKKLSLNIRFECRAGEEILEEQREAYERMLAEWHVVNESLPVVKEYVVHHDEASVKGPIVDIYEYVTPVALLVRRSSTKRVVALLLDYCFDPEEGIALLFEDERPVSVTPQSSVL